MVKKCFPRIIFRRRQGWGAVDATSLAHEKRWSLYAEMLRAADTRVCSGVRLMAMNSQCAVQLPRDLLQGRARLPPHLAG